MPLYTDVLVYEGRSRTVQGRFSDLEGFTSVWTTDLPAAALPKLGPAQRRALARKAHSTRFEPVEGRQHVWTKAVDLEARELRVYAVQTGR